MNTRLALLDYCARHQLDSSTVKGLWQLARFDVPSPTLFLHVRGALAAVSAVLFGIALICCVAANWSNFGRSLQFGLLEGMVLFSCIGAAMLPALRAGFSLFALLAIGALFAYFGQTYQTGADTWELFFLWSVLGLPLLFAVQSETIRVVWIVIAMTGIALWTTGWQATFDHSSGIPALVGGAMALLLAVLLSRPFKRFTGAGVYASGLATTFALGIVSMAAFPGIFGSTGHGTSALLVGLIVLLATFYTRPQSFDIFALCACALALNFLIDTVIVRLAVDKLEASLVAAVLLISVLAIGLCSLSISLILSNMRNRLRQEGSQ